MEKPVHFLKKHYHKDGQSLVFSRFQVYKTLEDTMFIKKPNQPIANSIVFVFV